MMLMGMMMASTTSPENNNSSLSSTSSAAPAGPIDLTLNTKTQIVRPIPTKLPWTISWYRTSIWAPPQPSQIQIPSGSSSIAKSSGSVNLLVPVEAKGKGPKTRGERGESLKGEIIDESRRLSSQKERPRSPSPASFSVSSSSGKLKFLLVPGPSSSFLLDVACCDGPVMFERVSNPNFALTVEHFSKPADDEDVATSSSNTPSSSTQKTYLCIYCNQSFKSLFCYQKHKKRHLNPVSVDITTSTEPKAKANQNQFSERTQIKDLNCQFFPCKKCGSKFPSYYFVHKHRKACHAESSNEEEDN